MYKSLVKKLDLLIVKAWIGPFIATFFITTFVLVLQFFWLYIDDIVGKGVDTTTVVRLITYVAATLVPLALPLAVLLSSIMTFGNLGESFELIAIKAAGIPLLRFMRPLFIASFLVCLIAFAFNNNIIPIANLRMNTLKYDIIVSKPAFDIKEGVFYDKIEGYVIKIGKKEKDDSTIRNVVIYEQNFSGLQDNIIVADSGKMVVTPDKRSLQFILQHGWIYQEGKGARMATNTEFIRMGFTEYKKVLDLSSFKLNKTDDNTFKNNYQMQTLFQLGRNIDSIEKLNDAFRKRAGEDLKRNLQFSKYLDTTGWAQLDKAPQPVKSKYLLDKPTDPNRPPLAVSTPAPQPPQPQLQPGHPVPGQPTIAHPGNPKATGGKFPAIPPHNGIRPDSGHHRFTRPEIAQHTLTHPDTAHHNPIHPNTTHTPPGQSNPGHPNALANHTPPTHPNPSMTRSHTGHPTTSHRDTSHPAVTTAPTPSHPSSTAANQQSATQQQSTAAKPQQAANQQPPGQQSPTTKPQPTATAATQKQLPPKKREVSFHDYLPDSVRTNVFERTISEINSAKVNIDQPSLMLESQQNELRVNRIAWHEKLTLSVACMVMFLIGAPLGSIIRKGGIGMPLICAVIFFVIFFLLNNFGKKFVKEGVLSPFSGMWMATYVLTPVGIFLTYKALHDSQLFNKEFYYRFLRGLQKALQRKKQPA